MGETQNTTNTNTQFITNISYILCICCNKQWTSFHYVRRLQRWSFQLYRINCFPRGYLRSLDFLFSHLASFSKILIDQQILLIAFSNCWSDRLKFVDDRQIFLLRISAKYLFILFWSVSKGWVPRWFSATNHLARLVSCEGLWANRLRV